MLLIAAATENMPTPSPAPRAILSLESRPPPPDTVPVGAAGGVVVLVILEVVEGNKDELLVLADSDESVSMIG